MPKYKARWTISREIINEIKSISFFFLRVYEPPQNHYVIWPVMAPTDAPNRDQGPRWAVLPAYAREGG